MALSRPRSFVRLCSCDSALCVSSLLRCRPLTYSLRSWTGRNRIKICHYPASGKVQQISIDREALQSHFNHPIPCRLPLEDGSCPELTTVAADTTVADTPAVNEEYVGESDGEESEESEDVGESDGEESEESEDVGES